MFTKTRKAYDIHGRPLEKPIPGNLDFPNNTWIGQTAVSEQRFPMIPLSLLRLGPSQYPISKASTKTFVPVDALFLVPVAWMVMTWEP